ncbi:MAG: hypothetical protein R3F46_13920 [bacterium]
MSSVATKITFKLKGLFGKSGRYYEFSKPLDLVIETEEQGSWIHRLEALGIWTVEPERNDSVQALMEMLDAEYEEYGKPGMKFIHPAATKAHRRFQRIVKHVY